ncbi:hypothetical protein Q9233_015181 [Columba guinea]|nr:hypothetical protein Q9233_015181 [Columba guinea]
MGCPHGPGDPGAPGHHVGTDGDGARCPKEEPEELKAEAAELARGPGDALGGSRRPRPHLSQWTCGEVFRHKKELLVHQGAHTEERILSCYREGESFSPFLPVHPLLVSRAQLPLEALSQCK